MTDPALNRSRAALGGPSRGYGSWLLPLSDQQPTALVLVQVELLDGRGLSALAIGRFDRAEIFAFAADDDDAPASKIGGGGLLCGGLHVRGSAALNG
jgi:hypothetical protein